MKKSPTLIVFLLFALVGLFLNVTAVSSEEDGLQRLKQFKASFLEEETFVLHFKQTIFSAVADDAQTAEGKIYYKKPLNLRWEYLSPEKYWIISDGEEIWMVLPEDKQVHHDSLDKVFDERMPFTLFLESYDISDVFEVKEEKEESSGEGLFFILIPEKPREQVAKIRIMVNNEKELGGLSVYDELGNVNRFDFNKLERETDLPLELFRIEEDVRSYRWYDFQGRQKEVLSE